MNLWEGCVLAIEQIRTEKLKSFFSLLGVVIGVMFLILVVSVVEGMDRYIRDDFSQQVNGLNTVTVRKVAREFGDEGQRPTEAELREEARRPELTYEEFEEIRSAVGIPGTRVGVIQGYRGSVIADNGNEAFQVTALGTSVDVFDIRDWSVERGRPFSPQEAEAGAAVAVLGFQTASVLFEGADPLGRTVRLRGIPFRVIGVLEEQGSVFGRSLDNRLIAPFKSPMLARNGPRAPVAEIVVQVGDPELVPDAEAEVEGILRAYRGLRPAEVSDFDVDTAAETISVWDSISRVLFTALPGLVTISLVVGGVVIMNIMLVSVMERTREIGIRKAMGARRRDVLIQVVVEATTLSAVGALLGVAAGVGVVLALAAATPLPAAIDPLWITVGVLLGMSVGILAGVYPALRASRMNPVDALRYE